MTLPPLLKTMRPRQWAKNAVVFAALVFDVKLFNPFYFTRALIAFGLLCLIASAVYIINDLGDIEKDRLHPRKKHRPLAAGTLSKRTAIIAAAVFLAFALGGSFGLNIEFGGLVLLYLVINLLYTFWLKNIVILDVLLVAAGFVIRVGAGVILVDVVRFSPWLYICMSLLALFMVLGKRRREITLLEAQANEHRAVLANYNLEFIDQLISAVSTSTIVAYSFYTFSAENLPRNHAMMLTIPFVLYGIFRYLYLIHVRHEGGAPDELVFKDRPLMLTFVLWGLFAVGVLYLGQ
ncbi:MAG: decaprenyl-phosphate phosphoribosyltransferase [Chloroflexi bacterium]|nr:decaprenyl-phosphate phosphoribosyltransferase [Chloroflexota bacterium]